MSNNSEYDNDDDPNESVEMLRARVNRMKYLLSERNSMQGSSDGSNNGNNGNNGNGNYQRRDDPQQWTRSSTAVRHSGIINGQFLSFVLCVTLVVIVSVAFYAFYNLYNAVLKKFPSKHLEL